MGVQKSSFLLTLYWYHVKKVAYIVLTNLNILIVESKPLVCSCFNKTGIIDEVMVLTNGSVYQNHTNASLSCQQLTCFLQRRKSTTTTKPSHITLNTDHLRIYGRFVMVHYYL